MSKKLRPRKHTVYGCVEGDRERAFLDYLLQIYSAETNNIAFYPETANGGGADKIVTSALDKSDRDKSFAWFDEDFEPTKSPLSERIRRKLAKFWSIKAEKIQELLECPLGALQKKFNPTNNKKPVLIVSQPVCSESLILKILGQNLPYTKYDPKQRKTQIDTLKSKLNQLMGGQKTAADQTAYYHQHLTREKLEEKRKIIPELDLLISMITK